MKANQDQKPGYSEWKRWADVLMERLTQVAHVYKAPPYQDAFLLEQERQEKMGHLVSHLRSIHTILENNASVSDALSADITLRDETAIQALVPLMRKSLVLLPVYSKDMQFLLKSQWFENCTGRQATELFCGPMGHEQEGIGSGWPEHGRLPEVIASLLDREEVGTDRPIRTTDILDTPQSLRRTALSKRRSSSFGSAGRID